MLKKLTEEQQNAILEAATQVFGEKGYALASISEIASAAAVSVGVIYKYYEDKAKLFSACIDTSMTMLGKVLEEVEKEGGDLSNLIRNLIRANQKFSQEYPNHIRMYHAITMGNGPIGVHDLSMRIEKEAAEIYTHMISKAKSDGVVRDDLAPSEFAFFFDNLMMQLHFSYSCEYYRERMKLYCGAKEWGKDYDRFIEEQLVRFIEGALGIRKED